MLMPCWFVMVAKRPLLFFKTCQHGFCAINSSNIYTKSALCRRPSMLRTSTLRWMLTGLKGKLTNVARIGGVTILHGLHALGQLSYTFCWGFNFTHQSISVFWSEVLTCNHMHIFWWLVLAKTPVRATAVDKIMRFHFEKPAPYPLTLKVWVPSLGLWLKRAMVLSVVKPLSVISVPHRATPLWPSKAHLFTTTASPIGSAMRTTSASNHCRNDNDEGAPQIPTDGSIQWYPNLRSGSIVTAMSM